MLAITKDHLKRKHVNLLILKKWNNRTETTELKHTGGSWDGGGGEVIRQKDQGDKKL